MEAIKIWWAVYRGGFFQMRGMVKRRRGLGLFTKSLTISLIDNLNLFK